MIRRPPRYTHPDTRFPYTTLFLSQLVVHPDVATAIGVALPEALVLGWDPADALPEAVVSRLARAAAVVVGPGMGEEAQAAARAVGHHVEGILVVDAQVIGCLTDLVSNHKGALVAAPNPKEAADLLGCDGDPTDAVSPLARDLADLLGGPAVVRGTTTVLDDGTGDQWAERERTPGLGTPGSGDVLMGALGAMLARGLDPLAALAWAIAAHARAGRLLSEHTPVGFLASEVADALPRALRSLSRSAERRVGTAGVGPCRSR